jgi:photosystem II stability/assembly factor-like uncharacterized protein
MAKRKSSNKARRTTTPRYTRRRPIKVTGKKVVEELDDEGPLEWFTPLMEETYFRLAPRGEPRPPARAALPAGRRAFESRHEAGASESALSTPPPTVWQDRLREYKARKAAAMLRPVAEAAMVAGAPAIPGGNNWLPLGPTVVLNGQTVGDQPVGGRVSGIAIDPTGQIVYVATASGGVFRSLDGGTSWRSLMDGFDVDPTEFASASLACGAIAIDSANPNRVYVGTGEGDTHGMFRSRVVSALPAFRGIGPIRSDDGGATWHTESTASGSPTLAGEAFFALAVDPQNRENVVAATTIGLYQRVTSSGGAVEWRQRRSDVHSSVVVASAGGTRRFFAAQWGVGVFQSTDGVSWSSVGSGLPTVGIGRIALAVQHNNLDVLYAFVAAANGALQGVFRLVSGTWKKLQNVPDVLPGSQGSYDLTIAVDPSNANLIYLGGDRTDSPPFPGSVWRCVVSQTGANFKISSASSIGTHAHADVHVLIHTPGEPNELWCGCDGGLFLNRDPAGTGQFVSQNNGLSCLCSNFIAQHPTDPNILFTGLQDNGTARTAAGPTWTHVNGGDGGYCLINWANPNQVLVFANGRVFRSTSGGASHSAWSTRWDFPWVTMTQPIVGAPFNPTSPSDGGFVAIGAGNSIFVSKDFAASWAMQFNLPTSSGNVFALAFASTSRLFIGTTTGNVFRADRSGTTWSVIRLDDVLAGPLGLIGLVTDVAVDWSDTTLSSAYIAFGGMGDPRRVWRFDGTRWEVRSGTGSTSLLDVEHNALVVDPAAPHNLYVGADIGVWHSADNGMTWEVMQNGLPDAPVFDLQLHATQRLLRAATHGRGLYEISLP